MSTFVPIVVDSEEVILRALQLRAYKERSSPTLIVNAILRLGLMAEIQEVSRRQPVRWQMTPANAKNRA